MARSQYSNQKARLTRAENSGDPYKILQAVEQTVDEWDEWGHGWPDDWYRWRNAVEDAMRELRSRHWQILR